MTSLIHRAAEEASITLERDVPTVGSRRCRDWAKLIGIARKLEAADDTAIEAERRNTLKLATRNAELEGINARLAIRLAELELGERMRQIEMDPKDTKFLLGRSDEAEAASA